MSRTIRTLALVTLLGCVASGLAQDPVTYRPNAANVAPPAVQVPPAPGQFNPAPQFDRVVVRLEGHEEWGNTGEIRFDIHDSGKVVMIDSTRKPVNGRSQLNGNRLSLIFDNCVYEGTAGDGVFAGRARYTRGNEAGRTWGFRLTARASIVGRTFRGNETLAGYGDVTFRFLDTQNVEMVDRDGVTRGTYVQNGLQLNMTFGVARYSGRINGDNISGTAANGGNSWTFAVSSR